MRVFALLPALGIALSTAAVSAQATQAPAGQSAPAPRPQTQTPPAPQQPAPAAQPLPTFQDGFKYAFINVQRIAADSSDGKRANTQINDLRAKLQKQIDEKNKALQASQQKLETGGSVLSDSARAQLQTDIERQQRDIQRNLEDAQQDVERLTQQLQQDFMLKLQPVIEKVAAEKKLDMIFNAAESGLVWAQAGMDLTGEIIKALDDGGAAGAKPAAAAPAAAPAPPAVQR
jgi:outer membrane protein